MEETHPTGIAEGTPRIYIDKIGNEEVPGPSTFQFRKY
ncbi:uncharacterized protein METZ01_LOCUS132264 [marine metagenome]|uniref:Uncharacterized protein n=1 Tax=marine metagenome TaxID=408172 RepID=A0A381YR23_9ZZZZ